MTQKKLVLLTGACGTVGKEVLKLLRKREDVVCLALDLPGAKNERLLADLHPGALPCLVDVRCADSISKLPKQIHAVIHLGAVIPPKADHEPELATAVNEGGTRNLLQALKASSPDAFFIYASSVSVYGDRVQSPMISVGDPLNPNKDDHYAHTKLAAEAMVQDSGLPFSIFRLSAIMGYGNHKADPILFHMPLNTSLEFTTPLDTAKAFVGAIDNQEQLNGRTFNLGGGEGCRLSYGEFLERSFKAMGLGKPRFPNHAFAEKNFHCGFYADSKALNDILHFQNDNVESYFRNLGKSASPVTRFLARCASIPFQKHLLKLSEPYRAYMTGNPALMNRFFGPA